MRHQKSEVRSHRKREPKSGLFGSRNFLNSDFCFLTSVGISVVDFEQTGSAHPATDAHRNETVLGLAPLALHQDVAGEARARHPERVTDRDRAAIDVVFLGIDTQRVATIETLA